MSFTVEDDRHETSKLIYGCTICERPSCSWVYPRGQWCSGAKTQELASWQQIFRQDKVSYFKVPRGPNKNRSFRRLSPRNPTKFVCAFPSLSTI